MDFIRQIPNIELWMLGGTAVITIVMAVVGIATSAPKDVEKKK